MTPKTVNCPYCGKILPQEITTENKKNMNQKTIHCPQCGSQKTWKNGHYFPPFQEETGRQRYLCRDCGYLFSKW